jgi:phosphoglycerate dehydrogenase-like enzyme
MSSESRRHWDTERRVPTGKPVAVYYRILEYQPENLVRLAKEFDLVVLNDPTELSNDIANRVEVLFAPLGYRIDRSIIDACPRLRAIVSNTTGHPHIDVDYARAKNIYVACLKFAPEFLRTITPTAELTWGLVLVLTRNVIPAFRAALDGRWNRRPFGAPAMLSAMSLGIVGHGRLGSIVARYGRAFGMAVRYYDPFVETSSEGAERIATLESLVEHSDIVSLHVPHEKATENLISRAVLTRFKRQSYLINTARGELLDWVALLEALESGHLAGAAFDVFEGEFELGFGDKYRRHPVLEYARHHDNLILTPHIGGSTVDAWRRTEAEAIDMALAHLSASGDAK